MKILVAAINFWPEVIGAGKYNGEMALWLARRGHTIRAISAPPYYPQWRVSETYRGSGFQEESLDHFSNGAGGVPAGGSLSILRCPIWVPKAPSGLKRILHLASFGLSSLVPLTRSVHWRPDVVVCVEPTFFGLPGAIALARVCRARLWLHVQDLEIDAAFELGILRRAWVRDLVLRLERWLLRRFDRISTISPRMVDKLIEKGVPASRVRLVENWVDLDVVEPLNEPSVFRRDLGIPAETCVVLYSGNMAEKQGLDIVIEVARLLRERSEIAFVLCGDGPARTRLEQLSAGLPNIRYLPLQPVELLNALLNLADIHVLPQRAEVADLVMPSKLTNMLASGRPVVATAAPGTQVEEVVRRCGIVVSPGDTEAFAGAIASLAENSLQRRQLGWAGREYAESRWAMDSILSRFERELLAVCGRQATERSSREPAPRG